MRTPLTPPQFRTWPMRDGYPIHGRFWPPGHAKPTTGFLYLHGIQSHGGWYEWSASLLAATGQPVLLPDRRGSGLNPDARGDVPHWERWLQDIDELAGWLAREHEITRLALVGVSWGGKTATAWALRNPQRVSHLLLVTPGFFPAVDIGFRNRCKIAWSLLTGQGGRLFPIPLNNPALFTENPPGRAWIAADSLKLTHATARFLYNSSRLDRDLRRAGPGSLRAATTLALAEQDRIIRNPPTEAWLGRWASRPPAVFLFPLAAHTLEFEPDVAAFETLLRTWAGRVS